MSEPLPGYDAWKTTSPESLGTTKLGERLASVYAEDIEYMRDVLQNMRNDINEATGGRAGLWDVFDDLDHMARMAGLE